MSNQEVRLTFDEYSQLSSERVPFNNIPKKPVSDQLISAGIDPDSIYLYVRVDYENKHVYISDRKDENKMNYDFEKIGKQQVFDDLKKQIKGKANYICTGGITKDQKIAALKHLEKMTKDARKILSEL